MVGVTACLVTRGDVDMQSVIDSLPKEWEKVIWQNRYRGGRGWIHKFTPGGEPGGFGVGGGCANVSVYGRYAAIEYASHDLIYVQDDDCIVSDPRAIVDEWRRRVPILGEEMMQRMGIREEIGDPELAGEYEGHVVCNMPERFRHDFYKDHSLVGFGAAFHRDAPGRAFAKFFGSDTGHLITRDMMHFNRCCDIVFTGLTPCVRVDVPHEDREFASDPNRMWKQPTHRQERTRMLDLVRRTAGGIG